MARRLDLHPARRIRNPGRHLRALARWPDRIADLLPDAGMLAGERFWNFKAQVYAKLVEPPHATPDAQRACIAAIFAAAAAIEASPRRPPGLRVACLVTTPFLFDSEVTLFPDEDYFRSFLPRAGSRRAQHACGWIESSPADPAAIADILPPSPPGLQAFGGTDLVEFDVERPDRLSRRANWVWAFDRR